MGDDQVYTLEQLDELEQNNEENVTQAHLNVAMEHLRPQKFPTQLWVACT